MDYFELAQLEHKFWLQIMGDHARFIFFSLAPTETDSLKRAQEFIIVFDQLLEHAKSQLVANEIDDFNRQAYEITYRFREFKLQLLSMTLEANIKVHLPSTFFNDMLNELEEYLTITNMLMNEEEPVFHPIHYHLLWLLDAIGHAASIAAELDPVEKDLIDKSHSFEMIFSDLNLKAIMMNGYLRTDMEHFPSLTRLNEQVNNSIILFMEFLENIRDQRMDGRVLGTLLPLMADHMAREECYYITKLSLSAGLTKKPNCDPTRPRIET